MSRHKSTSRHKTDADPELGTDSFLDIVANIVGILIILIVVAAIRVSETSKSAAMIKTAVIEAPPMPALPLLSIAPPPLPQVDLVPPPPMLLPPEQPQPPEPVPVSPQLVASLDRSAEELNALQLRVMALKQRGEELNQREGELRKKFPVAREQAEEASSRLKLFEIQANSEDVTIGQLRTEIDGVNRQITETPTENTKVLRHQLNPIGRHVAGKELHFRLSGNRVAFIPIDELVAELKPQIEKQKEWIARNNRYQGVVGPINGFRMIYVVERVRTSMSDDLRFQGGAMKIAIAGWKVESASSSLGETSSEALKPDSRFVNALRLADRGTTITLWTYPDSFDLFRDLQDAIHEAGLPVAARPLPDGAPIAGSPNGSRSTSQ